MSGRVMFDCPVRSARMTADPIAEAVPMFASPSAKATTMPRVLALVVLSSTTALAPWLIRPDSAIAQDPPDMARITGGAFTMGRDGGNADERPAHGVTLDPFLIDIYEVTNAQFAAFLNTLDLRHGCVRPAVDIIARFIKPVRSRDFQLNTVKNTSL